MRIESFYDLCSLRKVISAQRTSRRDRLMSQSCFTSSLSILGLRTCLDTV